MINLSSNNLEFIKNAFLIYNVMQMTDTQMTDV